MEESVTLKVGEWRETETNTRGRSTIERKSRRKEGEIKGVTGGR